MYFPRLLFSDLLQWKMRPDHKPLIVRGARQVGKSFLIEEFGRREFKNVAVVNFEKEMSMRRLFASEEQIKRILNQIEIVKNISIVPEGTLLFLDEIQACPDAITRLRYFYEEFPRYHVIAAGSLLEFVLDEQIRSFPVGRVETMYLYPLVFEEYLGAIGEGKLLKLMDGIGHNETLPDIIAQRLKELFRDYLIIGGMPEPVKKFILTSSMMDAQEAAENLIKTLEEDFRKYKTRFDAAHLEFIFGEIPKWIGRQINYSKFGSTMLTPQQVSKGVELLRKAMLITKVNAITSAQFPIVPRIKVHPKLFYLDVGLAQNRNRITKEIMDSPLISSIYGGGLAEQFVAQEILALAGSAKKPELFFWVSENRTSTADVDFVLPFKNYIIPVEVKSGRGTSLASLHRFNALYKPPISVRVHEGNIHLETINVRLSTGERISYELLSIPHFLIRQLPRLISSIVA